MNNYINLLDTGVITFTKVYLLSIIQFLSPVPLFFENYLNPPFLEFCKLYPPLEKGEGYPYYVKLAFYLVYQLIKSQIPLLLSAKRPQKIRIICLLAHKRSLRNISPWAIIFKVLRYFIGTATSILSVFNRPLPNFNDVICHGLKSEVKRDKLLIRGSVKWRGN